MELLILTKVVVQELTGLLDSYGIQPPREVIKYLGDGINYNTDQVQPIGEVFCGHLCLYVLKELNEGKEFQIILNKFF